MICTRVEEFWGFGSCQAFVLPSKMEEAARTLFLPTAQCLRVLYLEIPVS